MLSGTGPGRAGVIEVADDVDHVTDDELPPGDAVDLHRGQGCGRVGGLPGGLAGGVSTSGSGGLIVTDVAGAVAPVASVGIGLGLLSRGHRGGGGQDNHRGEQERQEGDNDGKTGDGRETTHENLRYIWRATRKRITDHRWYRVG